MVGIMLTASTGAMNSLLGKLATLMGEEFSRLKNLRKEVKFISDELSSMKGTLEMLAGVEKLDPQTKSWRDTLREMSYDIEDIIDDFMIKVGEKKDSGFVRKTIRRLKSYRARHRIAGQVVEIKKLVQEISERRKRHKIGKDIPTSSDVPIDTGVVTLCADGSNLVGMEEPTSELAYWLTDEEKQLKVVSVVGFGGLGKTTLANQVYHRLKGEFDRHALVTVSQKPDITKLLRGLLSELGKEQSSHDYQPHHLSNKLKEHLQDKRYLIVIDDLWDVAAWYDIKCAFPENCLGSRVIITSRNLDVAQACCLNRRDYIFNMMPLSDEDSGRLFFGRISGSEEACPQQLRNVSVEILKKCGGLPLAIISISSLLAVEGFNQKERWEEVRNSLGSMSGANLTLDGMRQILNLSYKILPGHLKTCLLYFGMYPEDYLIKRFDLERQWIAEGFVCKEHGRDMDKAARNYLNELVNRSLVQLVKEPVPLGGGVPIVKLRVHDMMRDLILWKSREENFMTVLDEPEAVAGIHPKVRSLSVQFDGQRNGIILPGNTSLSQVRSLMIFGDFRNAPPILEFKSLRVLSLDGVDIINLSGLCKLHHLRYLRIEGGHDSLHLPSHFRGLHHLETLDIDNASRIPSDIVHLPHLSHLHVKPLSISGLNLDGISNMKSLCYLYLFDLPGNSLDTINGLGELTNLRFLYVRQSFGVDEERIRVLCSSLGKISSHLEHLVLAIQDSNDGLMALSPPPRCLERLLMPMCRSWFSRVPNWMAELHNLRYLQLRVQKLRQDGVSVLAELTALVNLNLHFQRSVREIVFYGGAFLVLKRCYLCCSNARASSLTFQAGTMPKLRRLELDFSAKGSGKCGPGPVGIEHLLALEELSARINYNDATESDKRSAVSALSMHPSHPRVEIRYYHDTVPVRFDRTDDEAFSDDYNDDGDLFAYELNNCAFL